jgi:hypothetical protein
MLKGDPTTECTAIWGCPVRGLFLLGCGDDGQGSIVCVCLQNEDEAVTIDAVPATCSDETAIRDFARINCGWSWL